MATLIKADIVHRFTGTAAELLKQYPGSPYTAFVVTTQDQVECYAQHCARLSEGLSALVAVDGRNTCHTPDVGDVHHDSCMHDERRVMTACLQGKARGQSVQHNVRSRINRAVSACRAKQTEQTHPIPMMVTAFIDNRSSPCCPVMLAF